MTDANVHLRAKVQKILIILLCLYIVYTIKEFICIDKELNKVSENAISNANWLVIREYYQNVHDRPCNRLQGARFDFNNWIVLLAFNSGAFQLFENWFLYFKQLNLPVRVVAIAEDSSVFTKLQYFKSKLFKVELSSYVNISEPVSYNTTLYNELMSVRPLYKLKYLRRKLNILYADVDAVWLKNPFPNFKGDFDMWLQEDNTKYLCAGFMAVRSSAATINFMLKWHGKLKEKNTVNQFAFNTLLLESNVRYKPLDKFCFPSGITYFERSNREMRCDAVVVHNNYIVGIDNKIDRFKRYKLWKVTEAQ